MGIGLANYQDENNNSIVYEGKGVENVLVHFFGENNTLKVHPEARISGTTIRFDCDNGVCIIGKNSFKGVIRVGQGCLVNIDDNVTCTDKCYVSTAEESKVSIGYDCMIASGNEIRADDAHPIFDIETGQRVNPSKSIVIGEHVWIGAKATILSGSSIGNGSVIGYGSILKGNIPNNCIATGIPAKVIKKNIAWERPHLNLAKPYLKPNASSIIKSNYWNATEGFEINNDNFFTKFLKKITKK